MKLKDNEELLVRLQIKNGGDFGQGAGGAKGELKTMKDKNQQSYIDTVVNTLRLEIQAEMQRKLSKAQGARSPRRPQLSQGGDTTELEARLARTQKQLQDLIKAESRNRTTVSENLERRLEVNDNRIEELENEQATESQVREKLNSDVNQLAKIATVQGDKYDSLQLDVRNIEVPFREMQGVISKLTGTLGSN